MENESARKQTLEQLHERRKQVVRLHIAAMGIMKIVALTGLTYPSWPTSRIVTSNMQLETSQGRINTCVKACNGT